jgi:hypothetical protein
MSFQMLLNTGSFTAVAGTALGQGGGGHDSSGQGQGGYPGHESQDWEPFNPFSVVVPSELAGLETLGHSWLGGQHDMAFYIYV